jgi:hypothetical protein
MLHQLNVSVMLHLCNNAVTSASRPGRAHYLHLQVPAPHNIDLTTRALPLQVKP